MSTLGFKAHKLQEKIEPGTLFKVDPNDPEPSARFAGSEFRVKGLGLRVKCKSPTTAFSNY